MFGKGQREYVLGSRSVSRANFCDRVQWLRRLRLFSPKIGRGELCMNACNSVKRIGLLAIGAICAGLLTAFAMSRMYRHAFLELCASHAVCILAAAKCLEEGDLKQARGWLAGALEEDLLALEEEIGRQPEKRRRPGIVGERILIFFSVFPEDRSTWPLTVEEATQVILEPFDDELKRRQLLDPDVQQRAKSLARHNQRVIKLIESVDDLELSDQGRQYAEALRKLRAKIQDRSGMEKP